MCTMPYDVYYQRWSPRGHILKSLALALASKVKSLALALASRPQVLENWPVLGSRTALLFELLKFCGALEKFFGKRIFVEIARKIFVKTFFFFCFGDRLKNFCEDLFFFFFFWRALALVSLVLGLGLEHSCPWPRECLSSERLSLALALASEFFCVLGLGLGLEPCVLDSTSVYYDILRCSAYCTITSQPNAILCLQSYSAHCGILCLLCHNQHTMSIVPKLAYLSSKSGLTRLCVDES